MYRKWWRRRFRCVYNFGIDFPTFFRTMRATRCHCCSLCDGSFFAAQYCFPCIDSRVYLSFRLAVIPFRCCVRCRRSWQQSPISCLCSSRQNRCRLSMTLQLCISARQRTKLSKKILTVVKAKQVAGRFHHGQIAVNSFLCSIVVLVVSNYTNCIVSCWFNINSIDDALRTFGPKRRDELADPIYINLYLSSARRSFSERANFLSRFQWLHAMER